MSGEGSMGDLLGEQGHSTLEMCWMAFLERGWPLQKWNLEAKVDTCLQMETISVQACLPAARVPV